MLLKWGCGQHGEFFQLLYALFDGVLVSLFFLPYGHTITNVIDVDVPNSLYSSTVFFAGLFLGQHFLKAII